VDVGDHRPAPAAGHRGPGLSRAADRGHHGNPAAGPAGQGPEPVANAATAALAPAAGWLSSRCQPLEARLARGAVLPQGRGGRRAQSDAGQGGLEPPQTGAGVFVLVSGFFRLRSQCPSVDVPQHNSRTVGGVGVFQGRPTILRLDTFSAVCWHSALINLF